MNTQFEDTLNDEIKKLQDAVQVMTNTHIEIKGIFGPNILAAHRSALADVLEIQFGAALDEQVKLLERLKEKIASPTELQDSSHEMISKGVAYRCIDAELAELKGESNAQ